jgi:hypothetical protein
MEPAPASRWGSRSPWPRPSPPQGEVAVEGGLGQPFVGWLQLLRILVEVVAQPAEAVSPQAPRTQGATS